MMELFAAIAGILIPAVMMELRFQCLDGGGQRIRPGFEIRLISDNAMRDGGVTHVPNLKQGE
ncbi:hypothetical protein SDC9_83714 [bioreactor metagenome]|uniref:Uncharacterized protein n=1 Tax=bioreactor metagenome TaxID=1076179 RepID=A0A644ZA05_9ZZZZ